MRESAAGLAKGRRALQLQLERVGRRFGARRVFADVNAAVATGEGLAITGANGSGKSTLVAIMAGLLRPSAGRVSIRVDGKELEGDPRRDAIGVVAPDLALYGELTALENLRFLARLRGLETTDAG